MNICEDATFSTVHILSTDPVSSLNTGALIVKGGTSISGSLIVNKCIKANQLIVENNTKVWGVLVVCDQIFCHDDIVPETSACNLGHPQVRWGNVYVDKIDTNNISTTDTIHCSNISAYDSAVFGVGDAEPLLHIESETGQTCVNSSLKLNNRLIASHQKLTVDNNTPDIIVPEKWIYLLDLTVDNKKITLSNIDIENGTLVRFVLNNRTNNYTVTIVVSLGYEVVLNEIGDNIELMYMETEWVVVGK